MNNTDKTENDNQETSGKETSISNNGSPESINIPSAQDTVPDKTEESISKDDIISSLKKEIENLNDKHLRLYAEFDNFRRRTSRERIELFKNASEEIIISLLPVLDDLERAIKSLNDTKDIVSMKDGIELIFSKLMYILQQKGLKPMKSIASTFDSEFHQAIGTIDVDKNGLDGTIVEEHEKGYLLYEKVIRFAKVLVGKNKEKTDV